MRFPQPKPHLSRPCHIHTSRELPASLLNRHAFIERNVGRASSILNTTPASFLCTSFEFFLHIPRDGPIEGPECWAKLLAAVSPLEAELRAFNSVAGPVITVAGLLGNAAATFAWSSPGLSGHPCAGHLAALAAYDFAVLAITGIDRGLHHFRVDARRSSLAFCKVHLAVLACVSSQSRF